ncbi:MAG: hypothetical protein VYB02_07465 [Actinomycetota bacterium]|nr:hypothetical protein [Dehalococcoidia bacterium]MEC7910028.1 hypothetical protein [Actinomycetota bacterium]
MSTQRRGALMAGKGLCVRCRQVVPLMLTSLVCDRAGASAQPTGVCPECVERNELDEKKIISN